MSKKNKNYTWEAMWKAGRVRQFIDKDGKIIFAAVKPIEAARKRIGEEKR